MPSRPVTRLVLFLYVDDVRTSLETYFSTVCYRSRVLFSQFYTVCTANQCTSWTYLRIFNKYITHYSEIRTRLEDGTQSTKHDVDPSAICIYCHSYFSFIVAFLLSEIQIFVHETRCWTLTAT
jgi:hypothetical protein